jgi:hypothetical protein
MAVRITCSDDLLAKRIDEILTIFSQKQPIKQLYDTETMWEQKAHQYNLKKKNKKITWKETCVAYAERLCEECYKKYGKVYDNEFFKKRLCKYCLCGYGETGDPERTDGHGTLSHKRIKQKYFLTDRELEKLPYVEIKNPTVNAMMYMFRMKDAEKLFCEKHRIDQKDLTKRLDEITERHRVKKDIAR